MFTREVIFSKNSRFVSISIMLCKNTLSLSQVISSTQSHFITVPSTKMESPFVLLLLTFSGLTHGQIYNNFRYGQLSRGQAEISEKLAEICPDKIEEFQVAVLKVRECVDEIEENRETLCSLVRNNLLRCTRPMVKFLEDCFPEASKDIPNLVALGINSGATYLCKADGEHIFELYNSCALKTSSRRVRCENRIKSKLQSFSKTPPTKSGICQLARSLKPCLHDHLKHSCGHPVTRESFEQMFEAMYTPCKSINFDDDSVDSALNEVETIDFADNTHY